MGAINKNDVDISRIFLAFLALQGDVKRTALACGMEDDEVAALVVQEKWTEKINNFAALRESDCKVQIQINRAMGFVQACQLSAIVDNLIKEMTDPKRMMELLTALTSKSSVFSAKPLVDLVRAAEVVQRMKALALGDVQAASEAEPVVKGASIGLDVARALNAVQSNPGVDAVTIVQKGMAAR